MKNYLVALTLAFAMFLGAPATDMHAQTTYSHMGVHGDERTSSTKIQDQIAHMDSTGAQWVRYGIYWKQVEPTDNSWNFVNSGVDDDLNDYLSAGKKVLLVFVDAPEWVYSMAGDTTCSQDRHAEECAPDSPAEYDQFKELLEKIESEYSGINHYEVWNETFRFSDDYSTIRGEFFEHGPAEEDSLIVHAHQAVGASNSILCCGYIPDSGSGGFITDKVNSVGSYIDIITIHKYTSGPNAGEIDAAVQDAQSESGKEVWVTEFGMGGQTLDHIDDQAEIIDVVFSDTDNDASWGVSFLYPYSRDDSWDRDLLKWNGDDFDPVAGAYCRMVVEASNLSVVDFCIDDLTVLPAVVPPNTTCNFRESHSAPATPTRWAWSTSAGTIQSTDDDEASITTPPSDFNITVDVDEYYDEQVLIQVDTTGTC